MSNAAARPLLVTDSCCDLPDGLLSELGVTVLNYPVILDGEERRGPGGGPISHADFYALVRAGAVPSTAAIPVPEYAEAFRAGAREGRPVVLVGLSQALSGTFDRALMARDEVLAEYPDADIRVIESLNASIALGLLVIEAASRIESGAGVDELVDWLEPVRTTVNGYFTLDTLDHLRRGGRISDVAAVAGAMLDIKPILRIDEHGGLVIAEKVRGRKRSMKALVDAMERRRDPEGRTFVVAHGDAAADAATLAALIEERIGMPPTLVTEVGPVIGSHVGPGMLAVAFLGAERATS